MSVEKPVFGLSDIPDRYEIELRQGFVDMLDEINRPWRHMDPPEDGRGWNSTYWHAGTLHRNTIAKMSPEERRDYRENIAFFERLWGRHRYKDYHFEEDDPRRYVDTGNWIRKEQLSTLRRGIDISDSELEKVITGFRFGKGNYPRELHFPRLPIVADRWWAWILGHYFSTGTVYHRVRYYDTITKGMRSLQFRMRVYESVIPMWMEVARHIGSTIIPYYYQERPIRKSKGLRTTRRPIIYLGWPEYIVLVKFGLPEGFKERETNGSGSRSYKPRIPLWVKSDDECMRSFMESYINAGGISVLFPGRSNARYRFKPKMLMILRNTGRPEEYVERFIGDVKAWFNEHGIYPGMRKNPSYIRKGRVQYELNFSHRDARNFFLDNFEVRRADLRARLIAMRESEDDIVVYEALSDLKTPENVVLGMLIEQPLTREEINSSLQIHEEGVKTSLKSLQMRGLVKRRGEHYYYEPSAYRDKLIRKNEEAAEGLSKRIYRYSAKLLNQCESCGRVYVRSRSRCGLCGGDVIEVERNMVLKRLDSRRTRARIIAYTLGKEVEQ